MWNELGFIVSVTELMFHRRFSPHPQWLYVLPLQTMLLPDIPISNYQCNADKSRSYLAPVQFNKFRAHYQA